jgi:subtilisin family serine protease
MYLRWRANYDSVYEKFISAKPTPTKPAVKIAILDTGIDLGHQAIEARRSNIREMANWYNQGVKRVPDRNGHGTFAASLLLDYAPDAELYIAKIADKENTMSDGSIVAKVSQGKPAGY